MARVFAQLGVTSFGGPVAHLGYFRDELVQRRRWLDDAAYGDLVALGQFLPGPASSQVGFGLGMLRAGPAGALAAFLAFTLPSAALMVAFAYGAPLFVGVVGGGILTGLKIVAVAIVAQAVWGMARSLAPDPVRASLAVVAAASALLLPGTVGQLGALVVGAIAGALLCRDPASSPSAQTPTGRRTGTTPSRTADATTGATDPSEATRATTPAAGASRDTSNQPERIPRSPVSRTAGVVCLALFGVLLVALPLLASATRWGPLVLVDTFYRAGALVFGGGHVVLPLLQAGVVDTDWVSADQFLAGYGAAQAVPGPLFTFAAYLGALSTVGPGGVAGAALALFAIFLPGLLLIAGAFPFWNAFRSRPWAHGVMRGANAAVVGLLAAALYDPVFTTSITGAGPFVLALLGFVLLVVWRVRAWVVVIVGAAGGIALALLGG